MGNLVKVVITMFDFCRLILLSNLAINLIQFSFSSFTDLSMSNLLVKVVITMFAFCRLILLSNLAINLIQFSFISFNDLSYLINWQKL